jgi:hypothetical protein
MLGRTGLGVGLDYVKRNHWIRLSPRQFDALIAGHQGQLNETNWYAALDGSYYLHPNLYRWLTFAASVAAVRRTTQSRVARVRLFGLGAAGYTPEQLAQQKVLEDAAVAQHNADLKRARNVETALWFGTGAGVGACVGLISSKATRKSITKSTVLGTVVLGGLRLLGNAISGAMDGGHH